MNKNECSESKLYSLWNINGNKRYSVKKFINNGKFVSHVVFKDQLKDRDVIGKVVRSFSEGEVFHWPHLHHRSLAPLLDVVSIAANVTILISTYTEINLREIIHGEDFVNNPSCFANKKIYMEDILWGLDYLHRNSLVLMNIIDANIGICTESNRAVISNFSCLKSICQAKKCKFALPPYYQAPEISEPNNVHDEFQTFNPIAAEMWAFGVLCLEVFLQHKVPWALVDYNCCRALEIMNHIDLDTLIAANKGSVVLYEDLTSFKEFVKLFLKYHPYNRCDARRAALDMFLRPSNKRMDQDMSKKGCLQRNECKEGKVTGDNSVRLNDFSSTKCCHVMSNSCSQQGKKCPERTEIGDSSVTLNNLSSTKISKVISRNCSQKKIECTEGNVETDSSIRVNGLSFTKISEILQPSKRKLTPTISALRTESFCRKVDSNAGLSAKTSRELLPVAHSCSKNDKTSRTEEVPRIRKVHSSTYPNRNRNSDKKKSDDSLTHKISETMLDRRSLDSVHVQQESTQSALLNQRIESGKSQRMRESKLNLDRSTSESFSTKRIEESKAFETFKSSFMNLNNETDHNSNDVSDIEAKGRYPLSQSRMDCSRSKSMYFESYKHDSFKSYISLQDSYSSKRNSTNQKKMKKSSTLVQSAPHLEGFNNVSGVKQSDISISTVDIKRRQSKEKWKRLVDNENGPTKMHSRENLSAEKDDRRQNTSQNEKETDLEKCFNQNQAFELIGKWKRLPETSMIGNSYCILKNRFQCPVHSKIKSSDSFHQSREIKGENRKYVEQSKKRTSLHLYKSGPLSSCYYSQISESAKPSYSRGEVSGKNKIGHGKWSKKYSYKRAVNGDNNLLDLMAVDRFTSNRSQSVETKHKKWVFKRRFIHMEIEVVPQKCNNKLHAKDRQMGTSGKKLQNDKALKESSKCHKVKKDTKISLTPNYETNTSQNCSTVQIDDEETKVSRKLKNEKLPNDFSPVLKVNCHKMKTDGNISLPPNAEGNIWQMCSKLHANDEQTIGTDAGKLKNEKTEKECSKQVKCPIKKKVKGHKGKTEKKTSLQQNGEECTSQQAMISKRSSTILTAELLNNLEESETKDETNDKRKSFKRAALYCLCLGNK